MRYTMRRLPAVLTEDETLDEILNGASIARYGDGEFNLIFGGKCKTQDPSPHLSEVLKRILIKPVECMVGIPRFGLGPKKTFWDQYCNDKILGLLADYEYGSSFITRPDSAPWIDRLDYWDKVRSIWRDKHVTLVRGSEKSLTKDMLDEAGQVDEIIFPKRNAFEHYKSRSMIIRTDVVLLCCGPTATVMAYDLAIAGVQAIDLGHIGMFLRKHINGERMIVTAEDKAVDRS